MGCGAESSKCIVARSLVATLPPAVGATGAPDGAGVSDGSSTCVLCPSSVYQGAPADDSRGCSVSACTRRNGMGSFYSRADCGPSGGGGGGGGGHGNTEPCACICPSPITHPTSCLGPCSSTVAPVSTSEQQQQSQQQQRWRSATDCLRDMRRPLAALTLLLLAASTGQAAAALKPAEDVGKGGPGGDSDCPQLKPLSSSVLAHLGCQQYHMMCIDQQQFITYDPQFSPLTSRQKPPYFDVKDVVYNWPNPWGNGDKFERGKDIRVPPVVIRVNTSEEACPDLQNPVFSKCTRPIILWERWLYNVGEVFETSFVRMWSEASRGLVDPRHTLVVATPHGLRLPRYARVFFGSLFTEREVTSLAEFSSRRHDMREPSNSTAEGWHVRCFEKVTLCKIRNRQDRSMNAAGAHLLRHYASQLPSVADVFDAEGADRDVLKVVFASRPNATGRVILNEAELLTACNKLDPAEAGGGRYRRVKCVPYVFGRDLFRDLALAKTADVLVAMHGAAGYHSFYMRRGTSLVEVLPFHFAPQWANTYYARMLENDKKVFYWSIWVLDSDNSHPSAFQESDVFRVEIVHREHHVTLPWEALKHHLLAILKVGGDAMSYKAAYVAGEHCISDTLKPVDHRPDVADGGWERFTAGQVAELQRQEEEQERQDQGSA